MLCGQFSFDFAPDLIQRNPSLRRLVGRSFIKKSLEGNTVPQLLYFAIKIIRFGQDVFTPISRKQDDRSFLGKFKDVGNIDRLFGEVNQLHSWTTFPRM